MGASGGPSSILPQNGDSEKNPCTLNHQIVSNFIINERDRQPNLSSLPRPTPRWTKIEKVAVPFRRLTELVVKVLLLVRIPGNIRTTSSYNSIDLVKLTLPLTGTDKARCEWCVCVRERKQNSFITLDRYLSYPINNGECVFYSFGFC